MILRSHASKPGLSPRRNGFTLVEVIVAFTLSAVLISMMLPLIGASLQGSRHAMVSLPKTHDLRTEMDAIWQHYRTTKPTNLPALSATIATAAAANPPPYQLLYNDWVDFDDQGVEFIPASGVEKVLRVTIGNSEGESLTTYFFPIP